MDNHFNIEDLDLLFIQGKINEDEYLKLATEDINVIAIAVDKIDGITTVSLLKELEAYQGEVFYPLEQTYLDEKFTLPGTSLKTACQKFMEKIGALEKNRGHEFDITWYLMEK